jgi:cytochrome c peroxidase
MHDGRFQTLEEVVEFYNSGVVYSPTINPFFFNNSGDGLELSEQDKNDLVNFMKTLTDESFSDKEEYQSPF